MMPVTIATPIIFANMLPPVVWRATESWTARAIASRSGAWVSGLPSLGNFERIAIDGNDGEDLARLAGNFTDDGSVPERIAVLDARLPRGAVHPAVEPRGLADVQRAHLHAGGTPAHPVHPEDPAHGQRRRHDRLYGKRQARVRDRSARQGSDAKHDQIEGAADKLDDDQQKPCDQPDKIRIHVGA